MLSLCKRKPDALGASGKHGTNQKTLEQVKDKK